MRMDVKNSNSLFNPTPKTNIIQSEESKNDMFIFLSPTATNNERLQSDNCILEIPSSNIFFKQIGFLDKINSPVKADH